MHYQCFNKDFLEGMKKISNGSVDCVITDLPFGITACSFDKRIPFAPMWEQFNRVTKRNAAVVLFSQMPFGAELIMSNLKNFRYEIVWEKPLACGYLNANKMPLRAHENILVFYRRLPTYNPQFSKGRAQTRPKPFSPNRNYSKQGGAPYTNDGEHYYPRDVVKFNVVQGHETRYEHAQQKPIPLLEYLIKTYTNEGETILDATMGSGSTGVACVNTGRNFIGYETEKKFYDIALKRISEAMDAKTLSFL